MGSLKDILIEQVYEGKQNIDGTIMQFVKLIISLRTTAMSLSACNQNENN